MNYFLEFIVWGLFIPALGFAMLFLGAWLLETLLFLTSRRKVK